MVSYLHKYISVHISDKEIKDKILDDNPIPSNVKETQALDTYIKELMIENKKNYTLTQENILKNIQEKITHVLGPLSKLWVIMESEKDHILQSQEGEEVDITNDDPSSAEIKEISQLFEQTILLIGQAINNTTYYRRKNVLSTLIEGNNKVKEILKEQSAAMNASEGNLFGENFEEKLPTQPKSIRPI